MGAITDYLAVLSQYQLRNGSNFFSANNALNNLLFLIPVHHSGLEGQLFYDPKRLQIWKSLSLIKCHFSSSDQFNNLDLIWFLWNVPSDWRNVECSQIETHLPFLTQPRIRPKTFSVNCFKCHRLYPIRELQTPWSNRERHRFEPNGLNVCTKLDWCLVKEDGC